MFDELNEIFEVNFCFGWVFRYTTDFLKYPLLVLGQFSADHLSSAQYTLATDYGCLSSKYKTFGIRQTLWVDKSGAFGVLPVDLSAPILVK